MADFSARMEAMGLKTHISAGRNTTIVGLIGDTSRIDAEKLKSESIVSDVKRVTEPYKKANRKFHEADTVVDVPDAGSEANFFQVIAGPCSWKAPRRWHRPRQSVRASGAGLLRGGAFKTAHLSVRLSGA